MSELSELNEMIAEAEAILAKPDAEQLFPRWVTEAMLRDLRSSKRSLLRLLAL